MQVMRANKPFKNDAELVCLLKHRGLIIDNDVHAQSLIKKFGYHRIAGYRYPFRQLLPPEEYNHDLRQYRKESHVEGTSLDTVNSLLKFDDKLRLSILNATFDLEVRLRSVISRVLSSKSPTAHIEYRFLNSAKRDFAKKFNKWKETVEQAIERAERDEDDFIIHHKKVCYDPVPIWAALEYVSFGNLPYLLDLLKPDDLREVAKSFGVKREKKFVAFIRAIVNVRNKCAHGARIFNRSFKYEIKVNEGDIDRALIPSLLNMRNGQGKKIYAVCTILSYMLVKHDSSSGWGREFISISKELLEVKLLGSDESYFSWVNDMGFSQNWEIDPMWIDFTSLD